MRQEFLERSESDEFEKNKHTYFKRLGLSLREQMKLHKIAGLWDKEDKWRNVSEHCIVEAARIIEFSDIFGFPELLKEKIIKAAAIHDISKKKETQKVRQSGGSWDDFQETDAFGDAIMRENGVEDDVVRLTGAMAHKSLVQTEKLLEKGEDFTDEEIAFLCLHYIDDYTMGSEWSEAVENGENDFDRRMNRNDSNTKYNRLNDDGREHLGGRRTFEAQREIGKRVENVLADLISKKLGRKIEGRDLPTLIDQKIKDRIKGLV